MRRHPLTLAAALLYLAAVAAVVLWPTPVDRDLDVMGWWPVQALIAAGLSPEQGYGVLQVGANVLLFVPLGWFALRLVPAMTWPRTALAAALLSAAVELAQWALRPERVASWVDVVANTLGAALGAGLAVRLARRPIRRT